MTGSGTDSQYRPGHSESFDDPFLSSIMSAIRLMDEKSAIKGQLIPSRHIAKILAASTPCNMLSESHTCACGTTSLYPTERSFTVLHGPFIQCYARVHFGSLLETRCINRSQKIGLHVQLDLIPRFYCVENFEMTKEHQVCSCGNFASAFADVFPGTMQNCAQVTNRTNFVVHGDTARHSLVRIKFHTKISTILVKMHVSVSLNIFCALLGIHTSPISNL